MESPEDISWADYRLSKDPDTIVTDWNSVKDALFEVLNAQLDASSDEIVDFSEGDFMDIVYNKQKDIDQVEEKTFIDFVGSGDGSDSGLNSPKSPHYDIDITPLLNQALSEEKLSPVSIADTNNGADPNDDGSEAAAVFWSKHKRKDVFLPTYDESLRDLGLSDSEVDFVFQEFKLVQSTEDIFKVWDLDTPPEENDFVKQLNKALAGNPLSPASPFSSESEAWEVLPDRSVDDLISGIADLTLSPVSGQDVLT